MIFIIKYLSESTINDINYILSFRFYNKFKKYKTKKKIIHILTPLNGNIRSLWIGEEDDRRFVIKNFLHNKIISMPQTISFTSDLDGDMELTKTKNIYNKNNNLILISIEEKSYKLMKEYFENKNIILNPDTVLYLNNMVDTNKYKREYIMTFLRNDKESILGNKKDILINKYKLTDTLKEILIA